MKKKEIILTQNIVNLNNCLEMIKKGILPLVITLNQEEAERIDTIRKIQERNNKSISKNLASLETISMLYYGYFDNKENGRYMHISSMKLRELIESNIIYINKFIDYDNNIKHVDYIYPSDNLDRDGGIVFRDKPRLFKKKKDHYKLIKKNVHISSIGRNGMITIFSTIPDDTDCTDLCGLCFESRKAYEKKKRYKN